MKNWEQFYHSIKLKHFFLIIGLLILLLFLYAWQHSVLRMLLWTATGLVFLAVFIAAGYYGYKQDYIQRLIDARSRLFSLLRRLSSVNALKHFFSKAHSSNLPWFLTIGPAGAGKTRLLQASGIHFSTLGEQKELSHSDISWWFAEEAVILDAPGFFMDNPETQDKWKQFITKIKKLKQRAPLKALLLTFSCESLLNHRESELDLNLIRNCIDQLYCRTGIRLPIYLVVTQCDKLRGFTEFFSHLDEKARQQIAGFELEETASILPQLKSGLEALYQNLTGRLFYQIHLQSEVSDKAQCIQFPEQLHRLAEALQEITGLLCRDTIYREKIHLAGVYFSSAGDNSKSEKSYFIHDLLKKRLFTGCHSFRANTTKIKQLLWYRRAQWAGMAAVLVTVFFLIVTAYFKNAAHLQEGKILAERGLNAIETNEVRTLNLNFLESIAQHTAALRHYKQQVPWYQRLGMAKPDSQLDIYERLLANNLESILYKPLQQFLTQELIKHHRAWMAADETGRTALRGDYYTTLKLYLMLNFPKRIEMDFAVNQLVNNWRQMLTHHNKSLAIPASALEEISRTYLEYVVNAELDNQTKLNYSAEAVTNARHDLRTPSGVGNVYAMIENHMLAQLDTFQPEKLFGSSGMELWRTDYSLPRFFSWDAYQREAKKVFLQTALCDAHSDWVIHATIMQLKARNEGPLCQLNNDEQKHRMMAELNSLYFNHYLKAWIEFIASVKTVSFTSYEDASQQLRALQQEDGPFSHLFLAINENTALKKQLDSTSYRALPDVIRYRFDALARFTEGSTSSHKNLMPYFQQLGLLQQDVEHLAMGADFALTAEQYTARLLKGEGHDTELYKSSLQVDKLANQLTGLMERQAIKSLMLSPVQETYRVLINQTMHSLQQAWQQNILQSFHERLANYFPFSRHGPDANLAEFTGFFRPANGVFESFHQRAQPYLQIKGEMYAPKSWLGVDFPFSSDFLLKLSQLRRLSHALFPSNQTDLSIRYTLFPIPTAGIKEILFVSNGQSYPYRNGPQEWVSFVWPGQDSMDNETFIRVTQTFANAQASKEFQGVWGLFHLLASAEKVVKTDKGYRISWAFRKNGDTKTIQMLLAAKTQTDPFEALLFKPLQIPEKIMQ